MLAVVSAGLLRHYLFRRTTRGYMHMNTDNTTWQPIETAPVRPFNEAEWFTAHSNPLLLWNGHYHQIGSYHYTRKGKGVWQAEGRAAHPTHWMPLPLAPNKQ